MQSSDIPAFIPAAFASGAGGAYIRTIPQTTADPVAASWEEGFPPDTFLDTGAGGTPPDGRDFNGVLNPISAWNRWLYACGLNTFNATFSTNIGGYPKYTVLCSTTTGILWQSTAENNTSDPDGGSPSGWIRIVPTAASAAEILAGVVTDKFIAPDQLASALGSNPNYTLYPNGTIEQWGEVLLTSSGEPVVAVPLWLSYATLTYNICLTPVINNSSTVKDTWVQIIRNSKGFSGFNVQYQNIGSGASSPGLDGFEWRTIGR